ncbi:MAG: sugar ABC transporter permease [Ruminococcus sp.]|nr:sugar ABC transporter permease [Ruminococcus sp.]
MKLKTKTAWTGAAFALPALIGIFLFYLIPYCISLYYGFTLQNEYVGFTNFAALFHSNTFWLGMKNTAIFSLIAIPLAVVIPLLISLFLSTFDKHTSFFSSLFLSPLIVPIASVIYVWQIFFADYGVINSLLQKLGLDPVAFFKGPWAMALVIIIFVWKNCAYNIILFSAGLRKIPKEVKEPARLDGANSFQVLTKIVLPLLRPTTFFIFLLTVISSFKIFREVYLLYGKYPDEHVYMIQHFMNNNFYNLNYPRLSAASIVLSVAVIAVMLVFFMAERRSSV